MVHTNIFRLNQKPRTPWRLAIPASQTQSGKPLLGSPCRPTPCQSHTERAPYPDYGPTQRAYCSSGQPASPSALLILCHSPSLTSAGVAARSAEVSHLRGTSQVSRSKSLLLKTLKQNYELRISGPGSWLKKNTIYHPEPEKQTGARCENCRNKGR